MANRARVLGIHHIAADEPVQVGQDRFAFFSHYLDTAKPLLGPAGALALPPESPLPDHLRGIEYEPL